MGRVSAYQERLHETLWKYICTHTSRLHRVDAWLDADTWQVTLTKPKRYAHEFRAGDVCAYHFPYLHTWHHDMIYVGAGYVLHFCTHSRFRTMGTIKFTHLGTFPYIFRQTLEVYPHSYKTRLSRFEVLRRAFGAVGEYNYHFMTDNCQHMTARILNIPKVHSNSVYCVTAQVVAVLLTILLVVLSRVSYAPAG